MADVTGGIPASGGGSGWARWLVPGFAERSLGARTSWSLAAAVALGLAIWFWRTEGLALNVLFTTAITFGLAAVVALVTRRALLGAVAAALLVVLICLIASTKLAMIGMVLHAYDVVFYLGSWSTVTYLWFAARSYVIVFVLGLALIAVLARIVWQIDGSRVRALHAAGVAILCFAVGAFAGVTKPDRRHTQFYWNALYVSSFYSSWAETAESLWRGTLIESASAGTNMVPFELPRSCTPEQKPPHIILIHQESVVQPSLFPKLAYDPMVDSLFKSHDNQLHKLRVETYGGASWLTEFSILTGLSTHSFGGMRPFVQSLLAGKVRDTLPETLARCGYRNVLFYPMLKNFVSNGRFYDAIGLTEIFDLKAQNAPSAMERDRFYYRNAVDEMERHIARSEKPLFTYIQTMAAHWPYDYPFDPEAKVAGGGPGTDPEMHEYLRRVSMAKIDYDELKADLKRRFPNQPVLIIHYGDHHPMATRKLLGFGEDDQAEEILLDPNSIGFVTYYAVDALNYTPPPLPAQDTLDVPYLGTVILAQARLPLSEPNQERLRLIDVCAGRYHTCARKQEVLAFHRRLIESRLMDAR